MFGKKNADMKAQSAMEYLMTYGWAILIIAVVLAALFELGVFNGSNLAPQACIAQAGFVCKNPVYTANGIGITFGQTAGRDYYGDWIFVASQGEALNQNGIPINFTCAATGCANAVPVGVLVPGQIVGVDFNASKFAYGQIPANAPIGTPFAGYVWLGYCFSPCSAPTAYSKVATITAKEAGTSSATFGGYFGGGSGGSGVVTTTTTSIATTSTLYQVEFSVSPADTGTTTPTNTVQEAPGNSITISATPDSGYIFTGWSSSTGNIVIANTSAESTTANVEGSGTVTAGFAIPYVLVNLSTSGTTPSPFQQMLDVGGYSTFTYNGVAYNGINQQWSNVEFTSGGPCTSQSCSGVTPLQAWCETGCSGSSTAIVWVRLPNGFSGSTTIYMNFMPNDVMSASGPTGEAPQLSPTYAEYDDGSSVFDFYANAASMSSWIPSGSAGVTNSAPTGSPIGSTVSYYAVGSVSDYLYSNAPNLPANDFIIDYYAYTPNLEDVFFDTTSNGYGQMLRVGNGNGWFGTTNTNSWTSWNCPPGSISFSNAWGLVQEAVNPSGSPLLSIWWNPAPVLGLQGSPTATIGGGGSAYGCTGISNVQQFGTYIGLVGDGGGGTQYYQLLLVRAYPPNGVMPKVSFGALQ